jgi:hypothetical protein
MTAMRVKLFERRSDFDREAEVIHVIELPRPGKAGITPRRLAESQTAAWQAFDAPMGLTLLSRSPPRTSRP